MRDAIDDPRPMPAARPTDATAGARPASERAVLRPPVIDAPPRHRVRPAPLEFRAAVTTLARERREEGVGLDRLLLEVRRLAREAAVAAGIADEAESVVAQAVRWTVDAYLDEPALRHVPRFY